MDWVKVPGSALDNKRTLRLARALDVAPAVALGYMVAVATWCLTNEDLAVFEQDEWEAGFIEDAVRWDGEPGQLMHAFEECGFVGQCQDGGAEYVVLWWSDEIDPLSE